MSTELLQALHSSLCVRFGTTAPFTIGQFTAEKVGYAQIPSVVVTVICRNDDVDALVPIVRQRLYGELGERGWRPEDVSFVPSVQRGRRRRFTDTNTDSPSCAFEKMGNEQRFRFDMSRDLARATFAEPGSFKPLPDRRQSVGS